MAFFLHFPRCLCPTFHSVLAEREWPHTTGKLQDGEWYSGQWQRGQMHGTGKLRQKGLLFLVRHERGKLLSKERITSGGEADTQAKQAAKQVLESNSFACLSHASEHSLQMAEITIVGARNLGRSDFFGLSDPYAVLHFEEVQEDQPMSPILPDWTGSKLSQCKTKTCRKTLDPTWNSSFSFVIRSDKRYKISLYVWDWDMGTSDDLLGELGFVLKADQLDNRDKWYGLHNCPTPRLSKAQSDISHRKTPEQEPLLDTGRMERSSSFGGEGVQVRRVVDQDTSKPSSNQAVHDKAGGVISHILSPRRLFLGNGVPKRQGLSPEVSIKCRLVPFAHWEVTVIQVMRSGAAELASARWQ